MSNKEMSSNRSFGIVFFIVFLIIALFPILNQGDIRIWPIIISIIFLISIWLSTALLFTRIHQKLTEGYEFSLIKKLVKTNWLRTILWSLRLIILLL